MADKASIELQFFDELGGILFLVESYQSAYRQQNLPGIISVVSKLREMFYFKLYDFVNSQELPINKLTKKSLEHFVRFQNLDWTDEYNFSCIKKYLSSLKPTENYFLHDRLFQLSYVQDL